MEEVCAMKVRIKFTKTGAMKFVGHLDTMRYFQKAIRRAELPVAFSGGYSPHMIMSFAAPLGVGTTSMGEYFDMELTEKVPTAEIEDRLNAVMGIPAILAGILTQLGLYSVNLKIMGKANQAVNSSKYDLLVSLRNIKDVPFYQNTILIVAVFIVILIAVLYWFFGTEIGCSLRATGCNPNMSRAQGINTDFAKVLGLMISNGLVALSSAFLAQYQGFADVNMGRGAIVIGLAAVIIGEAVFGKIFRNFALRLFSVALGSILYYLVLQAVIWMGIDTDLLKLLSALVVAVFLAVPYWKAKYFAKPMKRGGNTNA